MHYPVASYMHYCRRPWSTSLHLYHSRLVVPHLANKVLLVIIIGWAGTNLIVDGGKACS